MASQISYQDALVDFPVISTEAWHLASTTRQQKNAKRNQSLFLISRKRRLLEMCNGLIRRDGMLRTGFEIVRQVHLNARISAFVPEHLPVHRRRHVRSYGETGFPWWAWGGGPVAADLGYVVGDYDVEVVVAA